jgi:hypothetical protein
MYRRTNIILFLATALSGAAVSPAFADGMDFFFHTTPGFKAPRPVAPFPKLPVVNPSDKTVSVVSPVKVDVARASDPPPKQALIWFENFDDIIFTQGVSDHEKYVLKRPINQDSERLKEWIDASNSVAKKYRLIAKHIRAMMPSTAVSDIREFQSESANWYEDTARMYEDLTAPRPPAKTFEELERAHQNFMTRSKTLADLSKAITELSTKLRGKYDVHQPKYTDESAKYVDSVVHHIQEK